MATPQGYGTIPYGLGEFGNVIPFALLNAHARGTHQVRVRLSQEPQRANPYSEGDVYAPASWLIKRLDTGERNPVIGVRPTSSLEEWNLFLLNPLAPFRVQHEIVAVDLKSAAGILIVPPRTQRFAGIEKERLLAPYPETRGIIDLKNDALFGGNGLQPSAAGYALHSKADALKKRLFRRLTGPWIGDPAFGLGLQSKALLVDGLPNLKKKIEEQLQLDPEVVSARANLTSRPGGILIISCFVTPNFGGAVAFEVTAEGSVIELI
jgi:hypothetical protein